MGYHRSFFGIGSITAIPSGTNPTPVDIAVIKGASVEFKSTEKELRGNQLFALDSATTSASVSGKIQAADFSASMVSLVIPGTTTATGRNKMAAHSAAIGTTPYQVTVTNSATFAVDFGVLDVTAGKALTRVAATPATGEYAVTAGVYTFAAADTTHSVICRYSYSVAATGKTLTSTNQTVGATAGFALHLFDPPGGTKEAGLYFPAVKFSNLSLGLKVDDWTETSLDFNAYADATGTTFYAYGEE